MAWKDRYRKASFRGVEFFVEDKGRQGGRRTIVHEYPMRDTPATEDLGRRARRFSVMGYLIGEDYDRELDALIAALEARGPATLVLPNMPPQLVIVDGEYDTLETREEGGFATIDMTFAEAGAAPGPSIGGVPGAALASAAVALAGAVGLI